MKKGVKYPHLQKARIGNCLICGKEFRAVKDFGQRKQKYCSVDCYRKHWAKDIQTHIKRAKIYGEDNHSWKGDDVGYHGIHAWIEREMGKPMLCEHCGTENASKYEWANIDHKYRRNKEDWMRVCTRCHRHYDYSKLQQTNNNGKS